IPKLGYYASYSGKEIHDALMEIYIHDIIKDGADYWSWESPYEAGRRRKLKTTFVYDNKRFVYITCYSSNLHIYGSEEVETTYSDETFGHHKRMSSFITQIREYDTFYPWTVPRLLLSVHSPFVPIDPFDGELLEKYHEYFITFRLVILKSYGMSAHSELDQKEGLKEIFPGKDESGINNHYMTLDDRLELIRKVKKRDFCLVSLCTITLEAIHTHFPPIEWLHINTDRTYLDYSQGAGEGIYSDSFSF
ncbi:hypothetical protein NPIL_574831, partial [Nephila pilipes]